MCECKDNWLSVSEYKPLVNKAVLVFALGKGVCIGKLSLTGDWVNDSYYTNITGVTHWQPLPTKPKEI